MSYWTIEPIWRGETVVILGNGPSLASSLSGAREILAGCKVLAINDALRLAPWSDAHYFCDPRWAERWTDRIEGGKSRAELLRAFTGHKFVLECKALWPQFPGCKPLRNYGWNPAGGSAGINPQNDGVYSGRNAGYQTIVLAAKSGAAKIILLGFDMKDSKGRTNWCDYPEPGNPDVYPSVFLPAFPHLVKPLAKMKVDIVNCTPDSALRCFPCAPLHEALAKEQVAA